MLCSMTVCSSGEELMVAGVSLSLAVLADKFDDILLEESKPLSAFKRIISPLKRTISPLKRTIPSLRRTMPFKNTMSLLMRIMPLNRTISPWSRSVAVVEVQHSLALPCPKSESRVSAREVLPLLANKGMVIGIRLEEMVLSHSGAVDLVKMGLLQLWNIFRSGLRKDTSAWSRLTLR